MYLFFSFYVLLFFIALLGVLAVIFRNRSARNGVLVILLLSGLILYASEVVPYKRWKTLCDSSGLIIHEVKKVVSIYIPNLTERDIPTYLRQGYQFVESDNTHGEALYRAYRLDRDVVVSAESDVIESDIRIYAGPRNPIYGVTATSTLIDEISSGKRLGELNIYSYFGGYLYSLFRDLNGTKQYPERVGSCYGTGKYDNYWLKVAPPLILN
jgi:hypothetical protein